MYVHITAQIESVTDTLNLQELIREMGYVQNSGGDYNTKPYWTFFCVDSTCDVATLEKTLEKMVEERKINAKNFQFKYA